jgi:hypothetical protein
MDAFDIECDNNINASQHEVVKAIWNRSHLKALKLAALKAVGRNWFTPVVNLNDAEWGKAYALHDAHMLLARFDVGAISSGAISDDKHRAILRTIQKVIQRPDFMASAKFPAGYRERGFVPLSLLIQANKTKAFADTHNRSSQEIMIKAVQELCDIGVLAWVDQAATMASGIAFSERAKCVCLLDATALERLG